MSFEDVSSNKLSDYFNSEEEPLEEPTFEYRICDFCLTPPCEDCLPWDFSHFKLSEVPLFFPNATEDADGVLDVHKHKNCRCQLFPISGFLTEENMDMSTASDDVKAKIAAMRNHKLVFAEEDKSQIYLKQAQKLSQETTKEASKLTSDKTVQTQFNFIPNKLQETVPSSTPQAVQQLGSNEQGTLTLIKQVVDKETALAVTKQIKFKLNPRQIYAFRSPQAMLRMGTREGINELSNVEGFEGIAKIGGALPSAALFFMFVPMIEKLFALYWNQYIQTQLIKKQADWDRERREAYKTVFRGIIPA